MTVTHLTEALGNTEPILCCLALLAILAYRRIRDFAFLAAFLSVRCVSSLALLALVQHVIPHLSSGVAYTFYFWIYWLSFTLETLLGFGVVYDVFRKAMAPLPGLQSLGGLMFRWALGISFMISVSMGLSGHASGTFLIKALLQLEQSESVLTLCMLLFVTLAIRPMGLSYRSKLFGVNLGLGILATAELISDALASHSGMYLGIVPLLSQVAVCFAFCLWAGYFVLPEPRRRMILLPTTSPFLRWNQISLALGDSPGFVAVGDVTLDMFAPAELEVMRRASAKMEPVPVRPAQPKASPLLHRVLSTPRELAESKGRGL